MVMRASMAIGTMRAIRAIKAASAIMVISKSMKSIRATRAIRAMTQIGVTRETMFPDNTCTNNTPVTDWTKGSTVTCTGAMKCPGYAN